jgi:hypothetical protein
VAGSEVKHSHAVVGEGPHRLLVEDNEIFVAKVDLILKGLPFHFIFIANKYKTTQYKQQITLPKKSINFLKTHQNQERIIKKYNGKNLSWCNLISILD